MPQHSHEFMYAMLAGLAGLAILAGPELGTSQPRLVSFQIKVACYELPIFELSSVEQSRVDNSEVKQ